MNWPIWPIDRILEESDWTWEKERWRRMSQQTFKTEALSVEAIQYYTRDTPFFRVGFTL